MLLRCPAGSERVMCGILGVIGQSPDPAAFRNALLTLKSRGPDQTATWSENDVHLGHTRLAIIDRTGGAQPMVSACGRCVVVFNGEIYNFRTLRRKYDYPYKTNSDTEVILAGYLAQGVEFISNLEGMYAFAIYDMAKRQIILSRDPFGIKPLLFRKTQGQFVFASEIKALLALGPACTIDRSSIREFLVRKFIPAPATVYREIQKCKRGQTLVIDTQNFSIRELSFWAAKAQPSEESGLEDLRRAIEGSVKSHLVSDVPVASLLSGGIDSSIVTMIAAQHDPSIHAFTVGFQQDPDHQDLVHARQVASYLRLNHSEILLDDPSIADLTETVKYFDEPFADSAILAGAGLMKAVGKHSRVVLSGDGGDEMFFGYPAYTQLDQKISKRSTAIHNFLMYIALAHGRGFRLFHRKCLDIEEAYSAGYFGMSSRIIEKMFRSSHEFSPSFPSSTHPESVRAYDLDVNLPDYYLAKVDKLSMAESLEVRVPLLSLSIFQALSDFGWAEHFKADRGKALLQKLYGEQLPCEVFSRPKEGFTRNWYSILGPKFTELEESSRADELFWWLGCNPRRVRAFTRFRSPLSLALRWRLTILGIWFTANRSNIILR